MPLPSPYEEVQSYLNHLRLIKNKLPSNDVLVKILTELLELERSGKVHLSIFNRLEEMRRWRWNVSYIRYVAAHQGYLGINPVSFNKNGIPSRVKLNLDQGAFSDVLASLIYYLTEALYCFLKDRQTDNKQFLRANLIHLESWIDLVDFRTVQQVPREKKEFRTTHNWESTHDILCTDIKKCITDALLHDEREICSMRAKYDACINSLLFQMYLLNLRPSKSIDPDPVQLDAWIRNRKVPPQYFYSLLERIVDEAYDQRRTDALTISSTVPIIPLPSCLINPPHSLLTKFRKIFADKTEDTVEIGVEVEADDPFESDNTLKILQFCQDVNRRRGQI